MNLNNDISKIGYVATTTHIDGSQDVTQATYYVPFNLFIFVFMLILAIALVFSFTGFYSKK